MFDKAMMREVILRVRDDKDFLKEEEIYKEKFNENFPKIQNSEKFINGMMVACLVGTGLMGASVVFDFTKLTDQELLSSTLIGAVGIVGVTGAKRIYDLLTCKKNIEIIRTQKQILNNKIFEEYFKELSLLNISFNDESKAQFFTELHEYEDDTRGQFDYKDFLTNEELEEAGFLFDSKRDDSNVYELKEQLENSFLGHQNSEIVDSSTLLQSEDCYQTDTIEEDLEM